MIKSQLYPYIETYINEYLYGFSKEQFNIGVMNGELELDKLNIRPDKTKMKLEEHNLPIWLKAGFIEKIKVSCSLMNFIGEKPIDVVIENIDIIVSFSNKHLLRNENGYILDTETLIREPYDSVDNNSHDIFLKKLNIYDTSNLKQKTNIIEIFKDKNKFSAFLNKIFTRAMKFYYQKPYLVNLVIKKLNIRFEDDKFNFFGKMAFGIHIEKISANLSFNGKLKKNSFKIENLDVYWEKNPKILIPTDLVLEKLDYKESKIDDSYYTYLKTIKLDNLSKNNFNIISNFSCIINVGVDVLDTGNIDFFAKNKEKKVKVYFQVATSIVNIQIEPQIIQYFKNFMEIVRSYFIIESIQNFKPMRKPYEKSTILVNQYSNSAKFKYKRKMVVRDWFYYFIWYTRFKKVIYGDFFKNPMQEEFSKYFNICCFNQFDKENSQLSDVPELQPTEFEDLNPENITLNVQMDILFKGINLNYAIDNEMICFVANNFDIRLSISENKSDITIGVKDFVAAPGSTYKILIDKKEEEEYLQDIVFTPVANFHDFSGYNEITKQDKFVTHDRKHVVSTFEKFSGSSRNKLSYLQEILNELDYNYDKKSNNGLSQHTVSHFFTGQSINSSKLIKISNVVEELIKSNAIHEENMNMSLKLSRKLNESYKALIKDTPRRIKSQAGKNKTDFLSNTLSRSKTSDTGVLKSDTSTNPNTTTNANVAEKKLLNFIEINNNGGDPNNNYAISFKINKTKDPLFFQNSKISDTIKVNIAKVRLNFIENYFIKNLQFASHFITLLRTLNLMNRKSSSGSSEEEIYTMRKYIYDKIKDETLQTDVIELRDYIKNELAKYDPNITEGKFYINLFFNELNYKEYDFSINFNEIVILGLDQGKYPIANSIKPICKTKLPDIGLQVIMNSTRLYSKIFDVEVEYYQLNKWKSFINHVLVTIENKFANNPGVEPFIKKFMTNKKLTEFNFGTQDGDVTKRNNNYFSLKDYYNQIDENPTYEIENEHESTNMLNLKEMLTGNKEKDQFYEKKGSKGKKDSKNSEEPKLPKLFSQDKLKFDVSKDGNSFDNDFNFMDK